MLDDRSAAVYPVAAVDVGDAVYPLDHRRVNVAADYAVEAEALDVVHNRILKVADKSSLPAAHCAWHSLQETSGR